MTRKAVKAKAEEKVRPPVPVIPPEEASAVLMHIVDWRPDARPAKSRYLPDEQLTRVKWDSSGRARRLIDRLVFLALHVDMIRTLKANCAPSSNEADIEQFLRNLKVSASFHQDRIKLEEDEVSFDVFADGGIRRSLTAYMQARKALDEADEESNLIDQVGRGVDRDDVQSLP